MTRHHLSKGFGHELIVVVVLQGSGVNAHFTNFVVVELQTNVQLLLLGETAPTCLKSLISFLKTSDVPQHSGIIFSWVPLSIGHR